jgi:hypothetical protein
MKMGGKKREKHRGEKREKEREREIIRGKKRHLDSDTQQ